VHHQRRLATHPDAGPFSALDETGARSAAGATVRSSYAFRRDFISAHWTVRRNGGTGRDRVRVTFPTSGRRGVQIEALLRDGSTVSLTHGLKPELRGVREFRLHSEYGSYRVQLLGHPWGTSDLIARQYQRANPRGGPTLVLELPPVGPHGSRDLRVRIIPSASGGTGTLETEPPPATTPFPTATPTATATP
jgi:hypothetical protein